MPHPDQIIMGFGIAVMCALGVWHSPWLIEHTRKGQRLAEWLGTARALRIVRTLLFVGAALGALLAVGILNPLRW